MGSTLPEVATDTSVGVAIVYSQIFLTGLVGAEYVLKIYELWVLIRSLTSSMRKRMKLWIPIALLIDAVVLVCLLTHAIPKLTDTSREQVCPYQTDTATCPYQDR